MEFVPTYLQNTSNIMNALANSNYGEAQAEGYDVEALFANIDSIGAGNVLWSSLMIIQSIYSVLRYWALHAY